MEILILAIVSFIVVAVLSCMMINEYKGSWLCVFCIGVYSMMFGMAIRDYAEQSKSPTPKSTEVCKDKVTLRTDSIIVFLK